MTNRVRSATLALLGFASIVRAAPPGGIEVTCDVSRKQFRTAAVGQTDVKFKLWSAASGGTQLGGDYSIPIANLNVFKRYTESLSPVKSRRNTRISATLGSDGSPALLPADGQAWLEVMVGTSTFGCDFASTNNLTARRRLQSIAFARESTYSQTCETCTTASGITDISARVFNNADITIANSVATVLTFNSEVWDTDSIHSTSSNTSRLTATTAGKYYIFGHVLWASNPTGLRQLRIQLNGSDDIATIGYPSAGGTFMSVSTHYALAAGNFVELEVAQLSGGPLNVQVSEGAAGEFGMVKLP